MPVTRFITLLRDPAPLAGICPACERIMDEAGCRIGDNFVTPDLTRTKGIGRVVEVFCTGAPTAPVVPCPACEARG
jgi:hypothetical protein